MITAVSRSRLTDHKHCPTVRISLVGAKSGVAWLCYANKVPWKLSNLDSSNVGGEIAVFSCWRFFATWTVSTVSVDFVCFWMSGETAQINLVLKSLNFLGTSTEGETWAVQVVRCNLCPHYSPTLRPTFHHFAHFAQLCTTSHNSAPFHTNSYHIALHCTSLHHSAPLDTAPHNNVAPFCIAFITFRNFALRNSTFWTLPTTDHAKTAEVHKLQPSRPTLRLGVVRTSQNPYFVPDL